MLKIHTIDLYGGINTIIGINKYYCCNMNCSLPKSLPGIYFYVLKAGTLNCKSKNTKFMNTAYFLFILFYVYFPCVVFFNICTVHGADPTLISLLVIQSLYSRVCDK